MKDQSSRSPSSLVAGRGQVSNQRDYIAANINGMWIRLYSCTVVVRRVMQWSQRTLKEMKSATMRLVSSLPLVTQAFGAGAAEDSLKIALGNLK